MDTPNIQLLDIFSRVLRDSTPRFVRPLVGWSVPILLLDLTEVLLKNVKKLNVGSIHIIRFIEEYWYLDSTSLAIWYSLPPRLSFLFLKCY